MLTGGEALLDKNLDQLIDALDPQKHLIILDTNGWTFDEDKARWFAELGGYKAQISLDSMVEAEHDAFRGRKGSYKRVIRALHAAKSAGLELLISTCIVRDRVFSDEFLIMCEYCKARYPALCNACQASGYRSRKIVLGMHEERRRSAENPRRSLQRFYSYVSSYGQPGRCITVKALTLLIMMAN